MIRKTLVTAMLSAAILVIGASTSHAAPNWSKAPAKKIILFYPGVSSLEWMLKGTEHGGARAMRAKETCGSCHEKEAADIGQKIVSGSKPELEKTPVKVPGSIPVTVQATHDGTHLYVRLQWKDTRSAPSVKEDAKNQIKAAIMIDAGKVEYAELGGCWASCHHDLRSMPDVDKNSPKHAKAKALDIQSNGPTKYVKESRASITNKDHPWGGWDKFKTDAEVAAALKAGQFYNILQYRSGAPSRDGYILDARRMQEAPGAAEGKHEGDTWTVTFIRKLAGGETEHKIEPGKTYNVGFAIHDAWSNERHHHVSLGYTLALDGKADISVAKQ